MIKFIATDLDGTLLDSRKRLPENFFDLVRRLHSMGIIFAAVSGRQYYSVEELFMPIRDEMMFIAENGGIAFEKGKMIYADPMTDEDVIRMTREVTSVRSDIRVILSGERSAYIKSGDTDFYNFSDQFCTRLDTLDRYEYFTKIDGEHIIKIAAYDVHAESELYPRMRELEPDFNVILSSDTWVDIVAKHVNKGNAVKNLLDRLGISPDEAMVFGDYLNDYEMMSTCTYSFAMENAHPELKKAAAFTAPSNDDNGVVRTIYKMIPELKTEWSK
ncbi:MAG: HAD family hydrolase [Huintestinicola sp.]